MPVPPTQPDVMGYCGGRGFGPFNWNGALTMEWALGHHSSIVHAEESSLRIFGTLENGALEVIAYAGRRTLSPEAGVGPRAEIVTVEVADAQGRIIASAETRLEEVSHTTSLLFATEFPASVLVGASTVRARATGHGMDPLERVLSLNPGRGGTFDFSLAEHGPLPIRTEDGRLFGFARAPGDVPEGLYLQAPGLRPERARIEAGRVQPSGLFWR